MCENDTFLTNKRGTLGYFSKKIIRKFEELCLAKIVRLNFEGGCFDEKSFLKKTLGSSTCPCCLR